MLKKIAILSVLVAACTSAYAFTWGNVVTITGYFVYSSGDAYIKTSGNQNPDSCASSTYLIIPSSVTRFKELYATVIAARASGTTVTINYDGCVGNYPKVHSIAVPSNW